MDEVAREPMDDNAPKKMQLGELFTVDGKMYMIIVPQNATDETNAHGQIVLLLSKT